VYVLRAGKLEPRVLEVVEGLFAHSETGDPKLACLKRSMSGESTTEGLSVLGSLCARREAKAVKQVIEI